MNPPKSLAFRHSFAKGVSGPWFGFAPTRGARQSTSAGVGLPWPGPFSHTCYPSPSLRSGMSQAGPQPFCGRRTNADSVNDTFFPFETGRFALDSHAIKNTNRCRAMQDPASRGIAGAVAGAAIADALDENMVAGAALGGLAGAATCGIEVGLPPCQPRY